MRWKSARERGSTFAEVLVSMAILAVSLGGFGMVVISSQSAAQSVRERDIVRAQAFKYMERLSALPFGSDVDPTPSAAALEELLDDDAIVNPGGTLTLKALETTVGARGWRFHIDGFESRGVFEIEVNTDLDGNGVFTGVRGTETPTTGDSTSLAPGDGTSTVTLQSENNRELMRVEIFWNGRSVMRTYRAAPVEGT